MPNPSTNPGRVLSFTEHLEELRVRIIICVVWFVLCFAVGLMFAPAVIGLMIRPLTKLDDPTADRQIVLRLSEQGTINYAGVAVGSGPPVLAPPTSSTLTGVARDHLRLELPPGLGYVELGTRKQYSQLYYLSPLEPIMLLIKGALLASIVGALPMWIYQLWLFIAPGLMKRERRAVKWVLCSALLLFPAGALFAYSLVEFCLRFSMGLGSLVPGLTANITAATYTGFVMMLMLIFGVVFEFPVVLVLLSRLGIISSGFLVRKRRLAIVVISIISAVATPTPDPFTMVAMLIPLLALYEGSIWTIKFLERAAAADAKLEAEENSVDG